MNIPKNDPYSAKENRPPARNDDDEDEAPKKKPKKGRRRMTLEMKLGVAFVLSLLTVFCVVLGVRLAGAGKDEAKVELHLVPETESLTKLATPAPPKPPEPTIVTERNTAPTISPPPAFAARSTITPPGSATPPGFATPPGTATTPGFGTVSRTAMPPVNSMPPAFATTTTTTGTTAAAMTTTTGGAGPVGAAPIAVAPPPAFAGDRYAATAPTTPTTAITTATPVTPPTSLPSSPPAFAGDRYAVSTAGAPAAAAGSANPLRAATAAPTTTETSPYAPSGATSGLTNVGGPAASPPTSSFSTTNLTSSEPRPLDNTAAAAQPITRQRGVAAIGATSGVVAPPGVATPPSFAASPAVSPVAAPAAVAPPPATPAAQAQPYVVAPNDSFWSIAEKAYGDGSYYRALYAFNSDRYPHAEDVRMGSVIDVPSADVLKAKFPELCGPAAGAVVAGGASPALSGRTGVAVAARTYIVEEGDTLFDIARRQLGKASYWSEIYNLNRAALGENLERLQPGTELMLPAVSPVGQ